MKETFQAYNEMKKEHKKEKTVTRIQHAVNCIEACKLSIDSIDDNCIKFTYNGSEVRFYPYTGWASGKSIKDGRGLNGLIKQIGG